MSAMAATAWSQAGEGSAATSASLSSDRLIAACWADGEAARRIVDAISSLDGSFDALEAILRDAGARGSASLAVAWVGDGALRAATYGDAAALIGDGRIGRVMTLRDTSAAASVDAAMTRARTSGMAFPRAALASDRDGLARAMGAACWDGGGPACMMSGPAARYPYVAVLTGSLIRAKTALRVSDGDLLLHLANGEGGGVLEWAASAAYGDPLMRSWTRPALLEPMACAYGRVEGAPADGAVPERIVDMPKSRGPSRVFEAFQRRD